MKPVGSRRKPTVFDERRRKLASSLGFADFQRSALKITSAREHRRRYGRQTLKLIEFRSMPPAPGDFSKSEHITDTWTRGGSALGDDVSGMTTPKQPPILHAGRTRNSSRFCHHPTVACVGTGTFTSHRRWIYKHVSRSEERHLDSFFICALLLIPSCLAFLVGPGGATLLIA